MTKDTMLKELRSVVDQYPKTFELAGLKPLSYFTWFERNSTTHDALRKCYRWVFQGKVPFLMYLQGAHRLYDTYKDKINWELMLNMRNTQKEVMMLKDAIHDIKVKWSNRPMKPKNILGD